MPGKQVKNWRQYHGLRKKGHSKKSAARIVNSKGGKRNRRKGRRRGKRKK
jgi:hypothetical protein